MIARDLLSAMTAMTVPDAMTTIAGGPLRTLGAGCRERSRGSGIRAMPLSKFDAPAGLQSDRGACGHNVMEDSESEFPYFRRVSCRIRIRDDEDRYSSGDDEHHAR